MRKTYLAFALLLLVACDLLHPGPEKTVRRFYEQIEGGRLDAAIDMISATVTNSISKEDIKGLLAPITQEMKSKGGVKGLEITKADVIGETADIEIKFTFGDGSSKTEHEKLLKEKGDWKIGMG